MLSIIIPTFNEAENIATLVSYLKKSVLGNDVEIIVSDGGSTDETIALSIESGAIGVLSPTKSRAAQMNFGASIAKGSVLYFIHADTFPPASFVADITDALSTGYEFGRYRTKFKSDKAILKLNAFFTRFDLMVCYGGDQTLFITKKLFDKAGGYKDDMLIMEDYDIVTKAKQFARYKIFKKAALVSARKYENNSWFEVLMANKTIVDMYKKGLPQQAMVSKYKELLDYK